METKYRWKGDEPWKRSKKEPDASWNRNQKRIQSKSVHERSVMEKESTQLVKVVFERNWIFGLPDMLNEFKVQLKIPLCHQEIMERMQKAFPGLKLVTEEGS